MPHDGMPHALPIRILGDYTMVTVPDSLLPVGKASATRRDRQCAEIRYARLP